MGAISFDGTLPVCSWAYVNICGWKGTFLKSFLCSNTWAGFCMCLSVDWICQEHLKVTKEGRVERRLKDNIVSHLGCVFYPRRLLYICLFSITTWSHFVPADCNLLAVTSNLNPQLPSDVNSSFCFLLRVAQTTKKSNLKLRSVMNDTTYTLMIWHICKGYYHVKHLK